MVDGEYGAQLVKQAGAGLLFSISSILIVFVNKLVLTTYGYVIGHSVSGWGKNDNYCF